jgi:hypothetical protein
MLLPPFWGYGIIIANLGGGVKGEMKRHATTEMKRRAARSELRAFTNILMNIQIQIYSTENFNVLFLATI